MTQAQGNIEQTSQPTTVPTSVVTRFKLPILLIGVFVFSVIATIFYTHFYVKEALKHITLETQSSHQQLAAFQTTFQQTQDELKQITETQLNHFDTVLNQEIKALREQTSDWFLLKARYYLELASSNARWTDDNQTTLGLLKEADTLLSHLQGNDITTIRQAIAEEQATILAIPQLDVTGILTKLSALQQAVEHLTAVQAAQPDLKIASSNQKNTTHLTWREHLQQTMQALQSLVVIRHLDDPISAYMTPTDIRLQREAIRLNLQEAQWSVLQRQTPIYDLMLNQASTTSLRVFDPNDAKTIAFVTQIQQLQAVNLTQTKPSIDKALVLLNQFIQTSNSGGNLQ